MHDPYEREDKARTEPAKPRSVQRMGMPAALELLETQRAKHADSVKRLTGQLAGVERALAVEKAKLEAVEEAIASVSGHTKV